MNLVDYDAYQSHSITTTVALNHKIMINATNKRNKEMQHLNAIIIIFQSIPTAPDVLVLHIMTLKFQVLFNSMQLLYLKLDQHFEGFECLKCWQRRNLNNKHMHKRGKYYNEKNVHIQAYHSKIIHSDKNCRHTFSVVMIMIIIIVYHCVIFRQATDSRAKEAKWGTGGLAALKPKSTQNKSGAKSACSWNGQTDLLQLEVHY